MPKKLFRTDLDEIRGFAVPLLIEQVSIMITPFVSSFISSGIGTTAVSAVNLVEQMNNLISNVFGAVAIGATVVVSQYRGKKAPGAAGEAGFQAIKLSLLLSLLTSLILAFLSGQVTRAFLGESGGELHYYFTSYFAASIISYPFGAAYSSVAAVLRGAGQARVSLAGTAVKNAAYIAAGLFFVNGLGWGISGTGAALIISNISGMIAMLFLLPGCKPENIVFPKFSLALDIRALAPVVRVGVPICIEQVLFSSGRLTTQRLAVGMGSAQLSANSIANVFEGLFGIPGIALSGTAMALVGRHVGARDFQGARDTAADLARLASIGLLASLIIWLPLMGPFFRLYTDDPQILSTLWKMALLSSLAAPLLWPGSFILPNALKGAGDVKFTSAMRLLTVYLFRVTFSYILGVRLGWGALGIWSGMVVDWLASSIIYRLRFRGGRWFSKGI